MVVLVEAILKSDSQQTLWIIIISLKDLKLGINENTIFNAFHLDAMHLFNFHYDLKLICDQL